jgi:carboxyl-terminal processing protease
MNKDNNFLRWFLRLTSYVLVAAVAMGFGFAHGQSRLAGSTNGGYPKLDELSQLIHERFIGEVDEVAMEDGAAAGMVAGLGDQWSYYIPASEYGAYIEQMENAYIGIGVTISGELVDNGF